MTSTPGSPPLHWCSVRCLFRHGDRLYEERITLWQARDLDHAIELAEAEARSYAEATEDDRTPTEYLRLAQAYRLDDEPLRAGAEVFSLMRDSALLPGDYLDRFFDTGDEHEQHG